MHVLYALRRRLKGGPRSSQGETHGETREALREDTTQNTPVTRHYPLISGRRQPRSRRWGHERSGPAAATKSTTHVHYVATSQLTSHLVLTLNCVLSTTGSPTIVPEKVYCGVRRQRRSPDRQRGRVYYFAGHKGHTWSQLLSVYRRHSSDTRSECGRVT